jgi:DNA polymerase-3 subunit epsilon
MMQGDFPLYTKRKLEQVYKRFTAKRAQPQAEPKSAVQSKPEAAKPVQPQAPAQAEKKAFVPKPSSNPAFVPRKERKDEPTKPIDTDMLKQLADKFKKG